MRDNTTDNKYEQLYTQLLERGEYLHERNKKRIRIGLAGLVVLPFILGLMIRITGSSKIAFLIIWIICMFTLSAYLISIEYLDDSIKKTLEDVTSREADFDRLLPKADLQERIRDRLAEIRASRQDTSEETEETSEVISDNTSENAEEVSEDEQEGEAIELADLLDDSFEEEEDEE